MILYFKCTAKQNREEQQRDDKEQENKPILPKSIS